MQKTDLIAAYNNFKDRQGAFIHNTILHGEHTLTGAILLPPAITTLSRLSLLRG